jgi:hypothetical protein
MVTTQEEMNKMNQSSQEGDPTGQPNLQTVPYAEYQKLKSQYDGLQGFVTQLKTQISDSQTQNAGLVSEYEAKVATLTSERDAASSELGQMKPQFEQAQTDLLKMGNTLELGKKIAKEFPGLSDLHSEGLLRTEGLEGEELDTYLNRINDKLGQVKQAAVDDTLEGSSPPSPEGTRDSNDLSVDELSDKLMSMNPNDPQYATIEQAYFAALK